MTEPQRIPTANATPVIAVRGLTARYGDTQALHGVDIDVLRGELVCLTGRNGAGKTTVMRSLMGLVERAGSVQFDGTETVGRAPEAIARLGMAYCPEERGIFSSLSVEENLMLPPVLFPGGMTVDEIYRLFPNLESRRRSQGTRLSGGEQQMLAIARILRTGARTLLLDEPTEGLAPVIVKRIGSVIALLKSQGYTVLLVEQNFRFAATLADRFYVIEEGRVCAALTREEVAADPASIERHLGI